MLPEFDRLSDSHTIRELNLGGGNGSVGGARLRVVMMKRSGFLQLFVEMQNLRWEFDGRSCYGGYVQSSGIFRRFSVVFYVESSV